ncbi:MAG: hypothetical protein ISS69_08220 [Phycisphaerae bacterium]|nr:hypothetical protein [Phycisphaerae bacterium]
MRNQTKTILTLIAVVMTIHVLPVSAREIPATLLAARKQTLELASPFLDHAVLQREMAIPVWGWAQKGSTVTVSFAGQTKQAQAGADGKWTLKLAPLKASAKGSELSVKASDGESLTLKDILVGEVWFSSGQSNMDWIAGRSMCRDLANKMAGSKEDIPVREFNADMGSSLFVCDRVKAKEGWKKAKSAGNFSALSLAFAYGLYEELKVPIGILRSTHGATQIETWIPFEGFASHPKLQDIVLKIKQSDPSTPEGKQAFDKYFQKLREWQVAGEKRIKRMRAVGAMDVASSWARQDGTYIERPGTVLSRPSLPGIADDWKGASRMYNFKIAPLVPYAIRGMIWCQGTHNANDGKIYAAKMEALINGIRKNWGKPDLPFYFTQMQAYGEPNPDNVGFADIREAQTLFFLNNSDKNVGMVPQYDLNSARPAGIHNYNKLDPGKRMARWALVHQYGKKIPYTGPIYKSYSVKGNKVHVQFEQRGPGGGLMVGSKGMAADYKKQPPAYFEPARATPNQKLKHFRLCGKDRKWYPADAVIAGDREIVVTSKNVPNPVGVQYAYSATPMGANLYNKSGLAALPFACFDGKQLFNEDLPEEIAKAKAAEEAKKNPPALRPYLQFMTPLRHGAVIQRNMPVPVWGFAKAGAEVTVTFAGQTKKTVVSEFDQWRVLLDPMPAATKGRGLTVTCSDGPSSTIRDVVVGDVWVLTGGKHVSGELACSSKNKNTAPPKPIPLLREFKIRTNARRFRVPRKRRMEIGGGKYSSSWRPAVFTEKERDTSAAAYYFASKVQEKNVPIGIMNFGADNPPLTWISHAGMQTARGFEKERDDINLAYPDTDSCKNAVVNYIKTLKKYNSDVAVMLKAGKQLPAKMASAIPPFPAPYYNQWSNDTETATHTYNFCISPTTPCAVKGVVWIPGQKNIGEDVSRYAPALDAYAASLAETYGQDKVAFIYAQPTAELVEGIKKPKIKNAMSVEFGQWTKSLQSIAAELGRLAAQRVYGRK